LITFWSNNHRNCRRLLHLKVIRLMQVNTRWRRIKARMCMKCV
jgi:hypothetical protein